MAAEFVIGIDLGTTNSVLSFASLNDDEPRIRILAIPQLVAENTLESLESLPSFCYIATEKEIASGALDLDWPNDSRHAVGMLAKRKAADVPDRSVGAAKSWLCHGQVDRREPILPWNAPPEVEKISPVTAARSYLEHLIAAWNQAHGDAPFDQQKIVLTVPASFDPVARDLTREAAIGAGFPDDFVLLEEPQAALYAWIDAQGDQWRKQVKAGERILVCDVGGGTTDLTLIEVVDDDGELGLQRVAVGEHLLVGGDNMDLALAYHVAEKFAEQGTNLDPWQSVSLWHSCRQAKETLLAADKVPDQNDSYKISVLGRGSKLIGGTVSVEIDRESTARLLLDGFVPACAADELPVRQPASGFQEIGLPYESDPAITRHIAKFLKQHCSEGSQVRLPDHVLFNGGVFKAAGFRERLMEVLAGWNDSAEPVTELGGVVDLDNSVSRGACYYGWSKEHGGTRIRGGVPSSYYVGIESAGLAIPGAPRPLKALCVVPFGMEEGTERDVPSGEIGLVLGQPVRFRFFSSPVRKEDQPGTLLSSWSEDELVETDPLETKLETGQAEDQTHVPVRFHSRITELGVFELWCVSTRSDEKWKLEFSVRHD